MHLKLKVWRQLNNNDSGHFEDYDEAVKARREAETKYFGEYCPNR